MSFGDLAFLRMSQTRYAAPCRIKVHPHKDSKGRMGLRFQHPAPLEVGEQGSIGWREEDNLRTQALAAGYASMVPGAVAPVAVSATCTSNHVKCVPS